jgi:hypothetical protein
MVRTLCQYHGNGHWVDIMEIYAVSIITKFSNLLLQKIRAEILRQVLFDLSQAVNFIKI